MESPMEWVSLATAAGRYDDGTLTLPGFTPAYLAALVQAGMLVGRVGDTGPEIQVAALDVLIERDLDSFVRREADEGIAS